MDPTEICIAALKKRLPEGVRVSSEMPAERPDRIVVVSRVGGTATQFLDKPRMELLCWDASDQDASALAQEAIWAIADEAQVHPLLSSSTLETLARDTWTQTGAARYRAVLNLTINKS